MINNNLLMGIALLLATTACSQDERYLGLRGEDIARTAESYEGSTDWACNKKGDFLAHTYKDDKFVYDVLRKTGVTAPVYCGANIIDGKHMDDERDEPSPVSATDWTQFTANIPNWDHMGANGRFQRGDIIGLRSATGKVTVRCGVAVSHNQVLYVIDNKLRKATVRKYTIRRYTGN